MSDDDLNTHSPIHKDEEQKGNAYVPHSLLNICQEMVLTTVLTFH